MTSLQVQTGERLVNAMGSMVADEKVVNRVINYIISLREPCQYSETELRARVALATEDAYKGKGISLSELRKEI